MGQLITQATALPAMLEAPTGAAAGVKTAGQVLLMSGGRAALLVGSAQEVSRIFLGVHMLAGKS
jgi:hypothetical protein